MEIHRVHASRIVSDINGGFLQPKGDCVDLGSKVASLKYENAKLKSDFLVLKEKIVLTDSLINSYASCKNKLESLQKELHDFKIQYEDLHERYGKLLQKHICVNNDLEESKKTIKVLENDIEVTQTKAKASESLIDQLNAHVKNIEAKVKENDAQAATNKRKGSISKSNDAKTNKTSPKKKSTIEKSSQHLLQHVILFGEKAKFANSLSTAQLEQLENFKKDASDYNISIDYIEEINETLETGPPSCCSADSGLSQDDPKFDIHLSENASTCSDYSKTSDSESYNKSNIVNSRIKSFLDQVTSPIAIKTKSIATSPLKLRKSLKFTECFDEEVKKLVNSSTYVTEEIIEFEYRKDNDIPDEEVNEILLKVKGSLIREISPIPNDVKIRSPVKTKIAIKNKFKKGIKQKLLVQKRNFMTLLKSLKDEMKINRHFFNKKIMKLENNITEMTSNKKRDLELNSVVKDDTFAPCPLSNCNKKDKCTLDVSENCKLTIASEDKNCININNSSNTLGNNCDILNNTNSILAQEKSCDVLNNINFTSELDISSEPSLNIPEEDKLLDQSFNLHNVIENKSNNCIAVHSNVPEKNNSTQNTENIKIILNETQLHIENKDISKNVSETKLLLNSDKNENERKLDLKNRNEKESSNIKNVSEVKEIDPNSGITLENLNKIQTNPSTNNKNIYCETKKREDHSELLETNVADSNLINRSLKGIKCLTPKKDDEKESSNVINVAEIKKNHQNSEEIIENLNKIQINPNTNYKNINCETNKNEDSSKPIEINLAESNTNIDTDSNLMNSSLNRKKCITPKIHNEKESSNIKNVSEIKKIDQNSEKTITNINKIQMDCSTSNKNINCDTNKCENNSKSIENSISNSTESNTNIDTDSNLINSSLKRKKCVTLKICNEKESSNIKNISEIKKIDQNSEKTITNINKIQMDCSTNNKNINCETNKLENNSKSIEISILNSTESNTNIDTDSNLINRSLKRKKCLTPINISAKKCKNDLETSEKTNIVTENNIDDINFEENSSMPNSVKKRVSHFVKDATSKIVSYNTLNNAEKLEKAKSILAKLNSKTAIMKPKVFLNRVTRKNLLQNVDCVDASSEASRCEPQSKIETPKIADEPSERIADEININPVVIQRDVEENTSSNVKNVISEPVGMYNVDSRNIVSYEEFDNDTSSKIEDGNNILTQIILEHLNECHKSRMKQSDVYENDCVKILEILENALNSAITTTSLDELVRKLDPYKEKLIAHSLVLYVSEAKPSEIIPVHFFKMPSMSYRHQSALCFIQKLRRNPPARFTKDIFELVMKNIEYKLFQLNNTPQTGIAQQLSLFYAILCYATKQKERLKVFCMDALYCMSFKSISVIASAMQVWPELFPRINDKLATDPLVIVMMHLITSICNKDKYKVENLSSFIFKNYGFKGGERNDNEILELFKNILKNKERDLSKKSLFIALLLFGKRCGATWCHKNIILDFLLPILDDANSSHERKLFAAELIGPLSRPFPITMTMQREIIREKLNFALKNEASPLIQEAIVCSLVSLSNRSFHRIVQDIIRWHPSVPISERTANTLKNFVKEKPPKFWNNNPNYFKHQ